MFLNVSRQRMEIICLVWSIGGRHEKYILSYVKAFYKNDSTVVDSDANWNFTLTYNDEINNSIRMSKNVALNCLQFHFFNSLQSF